MDLPSTSIRDLARRLLVASQTASGAHVDATVQVSQKLRISLTKFAGAAGFTSLLRRALALAGKEVPALQSATIGADGQLEKFELVGVETGVTGAEASIAITSHLLGLLVTFIGEPLTLRLVREAWPDASLDGEHSRNEAKIHE